MALYEYFCPDCKTKFDTLRPMAQADEAIACKNCASQRPTRVLSLFAAYTGGSELSADPGPSAASGFGGCCGGSCGCRH